MKIQTNLFSLVFIMCLLVLLGCSGSKSVKSSANKEAQPVGPTPLQLYDRLLAERIAAGEKTPNEVEDPVKYQLVYCENLSDAQKKRTDLVSPVLGYICQNTKRGKELTTLRQWKCGERKDKACICGVRRGNDFYDKGWDINKFGGGRLVSPEHNVVSRPCVLDE